MFRSDLVQWHKPLQLLAAASFLFSACAFGAEWQIRPLLFPDEVAGTAADINNQGRIMGAKVFPQANPDHPFFEVSYISAPNGGTQKLIPGTGSDRNPGGRINDAGQILGIITEGSSSSTYLTGPNGSGFIPLAQNWGLFRFGVRGAHLNNSGQALLLPCCGNPNPPVISSPDRPEVIRTRDFTTASDLNDATQVALTARGGTLSDGAYRWTEQQGAQLILAGTGSEAQVINNLGQVAGVADGKLFITSADLSSISFPETVPQDFRGLKDINTAGQLVGETFDSTARSPFREFFTGPDGKNIVFVDTLPAVKAAGWSNITDLAINDTGVMAGTGVLNGIQRGFILIPIPEPETYALMLLGLGLLGYIRKQRVFEQYSFS